MINWFCNHYLNGAADIDHWNASPARAKSLAGLPPAYVLTAGADPLRDEGDEYAARLKEAGVPMTYRHFPGQFHGFFTMGKLLQQANVAVTEIAGVAEGVGLSRWIRIASTRRSRPTIGHLCRDPDDHPDFRPRPRSGWRTKARTTGD